MPRSAAIVTDSVGHSAWHLSCACVSLEKLTYLIFARQRSW